MRGKIKWLLLRTVFAVGFWLLSWARIPLLIRDSPPAVFLYSCVISQQALHFKVKFDHLFGWVVFNDHFITKSRYYQTKICAGLVICVLAISLFTFSRAENFFFFSHTYFSLHSSINILVCEKKIMIILWYFKFTRNLVVTNCPTVTLTYWR